MKKAASFVIAFIAAFTTTSCNVDFNSVPEPPEGIWDYLPEIEVTPEDAFLYEYDSERGGMVITDYLRESPKIRIPDALEGEPVIEVDLYKCKKQLTEIIMPDTVQDFDFSDEIEGILQYLNVPASYKLDDEKRFFDGRYYKSLEAIYISDGVEQVMFGSFYFGKSIDGEPCESLKKAYLPNSVTLLGYDSYCGVDLAASQCGFASCKALESVRLPASLTELGYRTFYGCENLKSIRLPESVITLNSHVFEDCTSLESIHLPDSLTTLGDYVFDDCTSLESIRLPDGLTTLGDGVFEGCTSLESIRLPDSSTTLGDYVFLGCTSLKKVALNNGLSEIGTRAFYGCKSLESIKIPQSVNILGTNTFDECSSLKNVVIEGEIDSPFPIRSVIGGPGIDIDNITIKYQGKTYNYSQLYELD